ncbi:sulfurtransferase TusD [Rouxiella silvae]|uniref:Sulfurtransferase TusD n=1 Tax=Rouxiella silvae TaxID=1646373 RepID=A0AA41BXU0_9GAMM|nr:sulfurtransferase complex subunit TusD [Rouxiella silvae]KQN48375.1 sulfur relay protein TusD [Serratia sp. Leaf50]MBF6638294.1 sulfurtransferase complex subunit TusD [Rouxiella silvae]ORJ21961.1 sulfurtransferase TusD [Rouxiella silvae]
MTLRYSILVTGAPYGTQQASAAYQFALALLARGHKLESVFFYREGVLNGNQLSSPASDEFDLVRAWQRLAMSHQVELNVCVAAALRRGIIDQDEAANRDDINANLQAGFSLTGLGSLAEATLRSDRLVQF